MNGKMSREENRVLRRDKFAHKVKYSPKIGWRNAVIAVIKEVKSGHENDCKRN